MNEGARPPLSRVLLVSIGGVALGAVVLTTLLTFGLGRLTAERRALAELGREADSLADVAAELPCIGGARSVLRELGPRVRFVPDDIQGGRLTGITEGEGRAGVRRPDDTLYAARRTELCGFAGVLVVLRPAGDIPALPEGLGARFLVAAGIAVAAAGIVAFLLARRVSRPLAELTASVQGFGRGSERVPDANPGDPKEVSELRGAFVDMASDLRSAREREQAFLLSVTHELKTPLTAIRGWGEALTDGTAQSARDAGEILVREAGRLDRLVQDLLDLARLSAGQFSVEAEDVELGTVVRSTGDALAPSAREAGVSLDATVSEDATVRTDPDRVQQMLSNLVENAIRVTPAGGSVTVEVDGPVVSVTDAGPGLTDEDVEHAFDRFYLWRKYRGERPVGSGLGLAITGELARLLDVDVGIEGAQGGGTRFTLRFDA